MSAIGLALESRVRVVFYVVLYILRFDPKGHLEMATGSAMSASRFFHALGYFVDESYIVYFDRAQLVAAAGYDYGIISGLRYTF
jgi:hypothetical protein